MKKKLYNDSAIQIFKEMLGIPIQALHYNAIEAILSFPDFYIKLTNTDDLALSQNPRDEICYTEVQKIDGKYNETISNQLQIPCSTVTDILIAETVLYFTDHQTFSLSGKIFRHVQYFLKKLFHWVCFSSDSIDLKLEKILAGTIGGHEECVINPISNQLDMVDMQYANHVDAGIVLFFEDKCLPCFSAQNGFGFPNSGKGSPYLTKNELFTEYREDYRFRRLDEAAVLL